MHSSLVVDGGAGRVRIDCGRDWRGRARWPGVRALLITHGHEDHVGGLRGGTPCRVYATADTWGSIGRWPIAARYVVPFRRPFALERLVVEAWPVEHSLRAPAVGYRVSGPSSRIFYVPDLAGLPHPSVALRGVDVYVGDGSTLVRSLIRRRGRARIGHASIEAQLEWCAAAGVTRAIFTHCGSGIVAADPREIAARLEAMARARGIDARFARDGLRMTVTAR